MRSDVQNPQTAPLSNSVVSISVSLSVQVSSLNKIFKHNWWHIFTLAPIIYPSPAGTLNLTFTNNKLTIIWFIADVSRYRLPPLCNGAELTGKSYSFQIPFPSSQYQSHSVVSWKVGWRTEEGEERRLAFWSPRVMVSKHTTSTSTVLQETSHNDDPQYEGLEIRRSV